MLYLYSERYTYLDVYCTLIDILVSINHQWQVYLTIIWRKKRLPIQEYIWPW